MVSSWVSIGSAGPTGMDGEFECGVAWGWPFAALESSWETYGEFQAELREWFRRPRTDYHLESIIWRGLLLNATACTLVSWLVVFVPLMLRRAIRARRGLCPSCAYPVGVSRLCSECGGEVPRALL